MVLTDIAIECCWSEFIGKRCRFHTVIIAHGVNDRLLSFLCYDKKMTYKNSITIEPGKRGGKPTIRGMRITVYDVLKLLATGMSIEDIQTDYPELTKEDILAVLEFASAKEKHFSYA
jgi:uncharacterized protein (DUF433 family)